MLRTLRNLLFLLALLVQLPQAAAQDLPGNYEEARRLADEHEARPGARESESRTLIPYLGRKYATVLQQCFESLETPDDSTFNVVIALNDKGEVIRIYRDKKTNVERCVVKELARDRFPPPIFAPYLFHIEVSLKDSPGQKGLHSSPPLVLEPGKYSYTFGVPDGWGFSFEEARQIGFRLLFMPEGGGPQGSNSIVYVNEIQKRMDIISLDDAVNFLVRNFRVSSPNLEISARDPITSVAGHKAEIRIFTGSSDPRQAKEAIALFEEKDKIVIVVLTVQDTKTWRSDYEAFREIVAGYQHFTCEAADPAVGCD